MSLLDGTYEVLRQRAQENGLTLLDATGPDGAPLRIEWYELEPEREAAFERYRRALKRLQRSGASRLRAVTSRPGAHYVVWERTPDDAPRARDRALDALLRECGLDPSAADVRRLEGGPTVVGVAFGDAPVVEPAPRTASQGHHADGAVAGPLRRAALGAARALQRHPSWPLSVLLIVAAFGLGVGAFQASFRQSLVTVPDLVGRDAREAAEALRSNALQIRPAPRASDAPPGTVLATEPPAGSEIRPRRTVELIYALPPDAVAPSPVPDLVGSADPAAAQRALEAARFALGRVVRIAAPEPLGTVLAQRPSPGTRRSEGSPVDLLVSEGPTGTRSFLPDLTGLPLDDARTLARVAGIPADRIVAGTPGSAAIGAGEGAVVSQSLAPFVPFDIETATLRLIVERGAAPVQGGRLPDAVGLPLDAARALLEPHAARVSVREIGSAGLPAGVVRQSPPPGSPVPSDEVTLTVNAPPVPIPRPDATAEVRRPELREVPYRFRIEPGIGEVTATVTATTLEGERVLVERTEARGGDAIEGAWLTTYPGVTTFRLELNEQPYGAPLIVP